MARKHIETISRKFTPHEANRTLPLVKRIVDDILVKAKEYRTFDRGKKDAVSLGEAEEIRRDLIELVRELEDIGCHYKDWSFDLGLVDFPSEMNGQEVLLCWRSDESTIGWYHEPNAGYPSRKPIPQEFLSNTVAHAKAKN